MILDSLRHPGVRAALLSAALFGAGAPAAKTLVGQTSPWLLAGLFYCGSGFGLGVIRLLRRSPRVRLRSEELSPLAGAVVFGGVLGPVLLMLGLSRMPASGASLLLNAEAVFTALLAWFVFRENFDRRVALGMLLIVCGVGVLSAHAGIAAASLWPSLMILGACLSWGIDNNLTRTVSHLDATWLAAVKGSVAGPINLALAFAIGARVPAIGSVVAALVSGFFAYGVSLVLFIVAMRHLGTARAGAYYSVAPFFGALLALSLGEPPTWPFVLAAGLMAIGVWLHLTERHEHEHTHEPITHIHEHTHDDDHHQHQHSESAPSGTRHTHEHTHAPISHSHPHYPDSHHRHDH